MLNPKYKTSPFLLVERTNQYQTTPEKGGKGRGEGKDARDVPDLALLDEDVPGRLERESGGVQAEVR